MDPIQVVSLFLNDPYRWPAACLVIGKSPFPLSKQVKLTWGRPADISRGDKSDRMFRRGEKAEAVFSPRGASISPGVHF